MAVDVPAFAQTQLGLLASELAAEIAESSALVSLRMHTSPSVIYLHGN